MLIVAMLFMSVASFSQITISQEDYAEEEHKTYKNGDKVRISKFENGKYYFN